MNGWLFGLVLWASAGQLALAETYVQEHTGDKYRQGWKYVNDVSKDFVKHQNAKNGTKWRVFEPDGRMMVGRCQVPMKAQWATVKPKQTFYHSNVKMWHIKVSCTNAVTKVTGKKHWEIFIPTDRPIVGKR